MIRQLSKEAYQRELDKLGLFSVPLSTIKGVYPQLQGQVFSGAWPPYEGTLFIASLRGPGREKLRQIARGNFQGIDAAARQVTERVNNRLLELSRRLGRPIFATLVAPPTAGVGIQFNEWYYAMLIPGANKEAAKRAALELGLVGGAWMRRGNAEGNCLGSMERAMDLPGPYQFNTGCWVVYALSDARKPTASDALSALSQALSTNPSGVFQLIGQYFVIDSSAGSGEISEDGGINGGVSGGAAGSPLPSDMGGVPSGPLDRLGLTSGLEDGMQWIVLAGVALAAILLLRGE